MSGYAGGSCVFDTQSHHTAPLTATQTEGTISSQPTESPYLSVVIPAYNEAVRLPRTLTTVLDYLEQQPYRVEVLVVDDGSTDNTVALAEEIARQHPNVRIIRNDHRGKGYTVRTGMLAGQGKYLLFSDADLAVPIEEVEKLLPHLEAGYDVVIGSREGQGARRIGEPGYRHLMGRIFNLLIRLITLGGFQDTQCGFKAFRREAAHTLFRHAQLYGEDAQPLTEAAVTGFDVEILFLAVKYGYRVKEIPVKWIYGTETKVNPLKDSWRNLKDVVNVRINDMRGRYNHLERR
ncbi:MAG: glycosyltransferase family 2 protein, partial [Caldilineae bacterium]